MILPHIDIYMNMFVQPSFLRINKYACLTETLTFFKSLLRSYFMLKQKQKNKKFYCS